MEITAQQRKWTDKLREKASLRGKLLESFSPEFRDLMDTLREVDDKIREEALDLKDLLKVAETNLNRREYMTTAAYLGRFFEKMGDINNELAKLGNTVDVKHHDFLFGGLEPEHLEYLTTKMFPKSVIGPGKKASLNKEAGITDWWHNITTDRGKTLRAWEKRFPKYARELKTQTLNLLNKSQSFYDLLISSLKVMATYRAARKLEDYLKMASKLKERFKNYSATFSKYHSTQLKRFIDYQNTLQAVVPATPADAQAPATEAPAVAPATNPFAATRLIGNRPPLNLSSKVPPYLGGPPRDPKTVSVETSAPSTPGGIPPGAVKQLLDKEIEEAKKPSKEAELPMTEEKPKKASPILARERYFQLLALAADLP